MTQKELIKSLKASDHNALSYIYDNYSILLFRFINSYVMDEELSKDILQETFISLWYSRESIIDDTQINKLLYTIAKHKSLNAIRTKNNRFKHTLPESKLSNDIKMESLSSCEIVSSEEEIDEQINQLYNSLPELYKETFKMSRIDGLTYKEIATKLELSSKTIEKRISKVLTILKERTKKIYIFFSFLLGLLPF